MPNNDVDPLEPYTSQTITVSQNSLRGMMNSYDIASPEANEVPQEHVRSLIIIVRGMSERVVIDQEHEIKLGRFEPADRQPNDFDLTLYGAADRGVSRFHARLHLENDVLFVTDMGSTNGTSIEGARLAPYTPTPLRSGDKFVLGRLPIQVMFG